MKIISNVAFSLGLLALAVWGGYMVCGPKGYGELVELRLRAANITTETEAILRENRMIEEMVSRLKHDGKYIEHIARHEMGLAGKNDLIFTFDDPMHEETVDLSGKHD